MPGIHLWRTISKSFWVRECLPCQPHRPICMHSTRFKPKLSHIMWFHYDVLPVHDRKKLHDLVTPPLQYFQGEKSQDIHLSMFPLEGHSSALSIALAEHFQEGFWSTHWFQNPLSFLLLFFCLQTQQETKLPQITHLRHKQPSHWLRSSQQLKCKHWWLVCRLTCTR